MPLAVPPESGQLVEVRRRYWIAKDPVVAAPVHPDGHPTTLVTLTSVSEDAIGQSIQVLWELEAGARVIESGRLPTLDDVDDAERLQAFLDAVRWGAATSADRSALQAPFRSGVELQDFQLDPLVRALDMARVNLLIADDVGLGKTIEAGLVIQELLIRHRARTVLIVCPASLQVKWQTEMQEKFGLEFRIVDSAYVREQRRQRGIHDNPWKTFPRLITSMDWAKSGEGMRLLRDRLPPHAVYPRPMDILVVDEVHNATPAVGADNRLDAGNSQRTSLIRKLAPHFEHKLFLSATPHNGFPESFTCLLELLDDQRFSAGVMPEEKQRQQVMVRRLKTELVDAQGKPIYPTRKLLPLEIAYTAEEREAHALLCAYAKSREATLRGSGSGRGTKFIHKLLKKRLFSSPRAFAGTLAVHIEGYENPDRGRERRAVDERILRRAILRAEEDYADEGQADQATAEAVEAATRQEIPLTADQSKMLKKLRKWADAAANRPDSKAEAILDWLRRHLRTDGRGNAERVIIFTEYRDTLSWIHQILAREGFAEDGYLEILHGGTDHDDRERIKAAFQDDPAHSKVRILLATDAASEGIDLQNHCRYLIHIELPWNPNVLEQRNGRIDRHGQRHPEVMIWHPVGAGYSPDRDRAPGDLDGDAEFLMRVAMKVDQIRQDLGSVGPVIARQIESAMLGQGATRLDTAEAEAQAVRSRAWLAADKRVRERIAKLRTLLEESRAEAQLTPERVASAVQVALALAGKPLLTPFPLPGAAPGTVFEVPYLEGSWKQDLAGLEHPNRRHRRPITFDHAVAFRRDDVVLAHLGHRFVQRCLRLLRSQVWAQAGTGLHRATVRSVPDAQLADPVAMIWSRLVITGGVSYRLHEELVLSGCWLRPDNAARIPAPKLDELLRGSSPVTPSVAALAALRERYQRWQPALMDGAKARCDERRGTLVRKLEERRDADMEALSTILKDLKASLTKELDVASQPEQQVIPGVLEVDETPQERVRRYRDSLHARLDRIPQEEIDERAAIARRYADPQTQVFPAAVIILAPERLLGGI